MTGPVDPPGEDVPPSIAAIMAAIRAEIVAPAPTAAADDASGDEHGEDAAGASDSGHLMASGRDIDPAGHAPWAADHAIEATGHFSDVSVEAAPDAVPGHAATPATADTPAPVDPAALHAADDDMIARGAAMAAPDPADVRAALAPLLKDWLDTHLPEIVEAAVHAEIRRLTGMTG